MSIFVSPPDTNAVSVILIHEMSFFYTKGDAVCCVIFYPRDAMLARSLRQRRVRPDVRLSQPVLCENGAF